MKELMDKWIDALHSGDPMAVSALYAEKASFLPTMSGDHKVGVNGALEYFLGFLRNKPKVEWCTFEIPYQGEDSVLHSGFYGFFLVETSQLVKARFSMLWSKKNDDGEWRIAHHHSSISP